MSTPTPSDSPVPPLREWWHIEFQDFAGYWIYYGLENFPSPQEAEDEIHESRHDPKHWGYQYRHYPARIVKVTEREQQVIPGILKLVVEYDREEGETCP